MAPSRRPGGQHLIHSQFHPATYPQGLLLALLTEAFLARPPRQAILLLQSWFQILQVFPFKNPFRSVFPTVLPQPQAEAVAGAEEAVVEVEVEVEAEVVAELEVEAAAVRGVVAVAVAAVEAPGAAEEAAVRVGAEVEVAAGVARALEPRSITCRKTVAGVKPGKGRRTSWTARPLLAMELSSR